MMDVIPAVDIMRGKVVRLVRGDPKRAKVYEHLGDPVSLAKRWESEGARIIHVIDLDAALGLGNNTRIVKEIVHVVKVPVQVGGGIRSLNSARRLLEMGVSRVVLGSLAFEEPCAIQALLEGFGADRVVVALDNLGGEVVVHGWTASTRVTVDEAVDRFAAMGAEFFLVTCVARDGTLSGPGFESLLRVCRRDVKVIAAGGIQSLDDLVALKRLGVVGAVVGKALYEGRFSLGEALRRVEND